MSRRHNKTTTRRPPRRERCLRLRPACAAVIGPSDTNRRILVQCTLAADTARMWYAICSKKDCGWSMVAHSKLSAMLLADGHQYERYRDSTHRVHVVDIPTESEQPPNSPPDPRQTR